jgi:hypothetical protein
MNFPDEFALDGEPFHVPAAIDPQIGDLVNSEERALCQNVLLSELQKTIVILKS